MLIREIRGQKYKQMKAASIVLFLFVSCALPNRVLAGDGPWKEIKQKDEIIIIRPEEHAQKEGQPFAGKGETTYILTGKDLGKAGEIAAADLEKYLPLSCGCRTEAISGNTSANQKKGFTVLLATPRSSPLLHWAGLEYLENPGPQECLILPVKAFPDGTQGVALIGGSPRGLLNGVYTLLEKTAGVFWEPVRVLNPKDPLYSNINETTLRAGNKLLWAEGNLKWKPVVRDRIIYMGYTTVTKRTVDWASRNRMTHFVIATPHDLPMPEDMAKELKTIVDYAHERGLRVLFMNMTHRLPASSPALPASGEEALNASTRLYLNQYKRFGLDGMTWHVASEGIHVNMDEAYKKKPRIEWEAKYFNSYYHALRQVDHDAILSMLMGWVYMNPADTLARLFPPDVIAWIVPYTPIIDAALTDLDSYTNNFNHIWYWLYVTVSRDGNFPVVKTDYLEKYFREAIKRGHGLAPQAVLYNNNENAMYYAQSARDGVIPNEEFLRSFAERYYGDPQMGPALIQYQEALVDHRNWYNNIQTVDIPYYFTFREKEYLEEVFNTCIRTAKTARTPLIKNRLKTLTITTLRCLYKRSNPPYGFKQFSAMIDEVKSVFPDSYFGKEKDFFMQELLKMEQEANENRNRN